MAANGIIGADVAELQANGEKLISYSGELDDSLNTIQGMGLSS